MDIEIFFTKNNKINTNSLIKYNELFENQIIPKTSFLNFPTKTQRLWHVYNKMYSNFLCKGGNLTSFINFKKGYRLCCNDKKCICREKSKEVRNNTILNKYNVNNISQLDFVKKKKIKTLLKNYNVTNPSKSGIIQDKKIVTSEKRYGTLHPMKSDVVKEKQRQKLIKKYNVYNPTYIHLKEILVLINSSDFWKQFNSYVEIKEYFTGKVVDSTIINYAKKYRPDLYTISDTISYPHKIINEFLDSLGVEYVTNTRAIISPIELDIYIPTKNLAIEINGVYWHTEEKGKDSTYHINKLEKCEDKDIDLIHLTDIDILTKKVIVFNLIKDKLNLNDEINVKDCNVIDLDKETAKEFINKNSLFQYKESNIHKGLIYQDELVSTLCVKTIQDNIFEVTNYTDKIGYNIKNSLSILTKDIRGKFTVYVDRNVLNKNTFNESNWKLTSVVDPDYFYYKDDKLYDKNNLCLEDYPKFWNCGYLVYIFKNKTLQF